MEKNTISELDIMVDGMAEYAFPYLDELFEDYGLEIYNRVGVQLLMEERGCPRNLAERLVEAWSIRKEKYDKEDV